MNLKYGEFDILERELEALAPMHRVAFAAACCERLYPHYDIYLRAAREDDWDGEDLFRVALDEIWEFLVGKKIDASRFRQLYFNCDESYPDYENVDTPEAQTAAGAILNTLELCLDPRVQHTISVAKEIDETLFIYIEREVVVLAMGRRPLLGTALIEDYHLSVDFYEGGSVAIDEIL